MRYRNKFQIMTDILKVAIDGKATKTRLMYGSFLSFAQINEYLGMLKENGLLTLDDMTRKYSLTQNGLEFIHTYESMEKLLPSNEPSPIIKSGYQ